MLWIVALVTAWLGAFLLLAALVTAAARADRPTAEHRARSAAARNLRVWPKSPRSPSLSRARPRPTRPGSAAAPRLTSKGIAPGDIVEIDRKGRRFHALVTAIEQRDSGRFDLEVRPLDGRSTWRSATVREVVGVWRRGARRGDRRRRRPGRATPRGPAAAPGA